MKRESKTAHASTPHDTPPALIDFHSPAYAPFLEQWKSSGRVAPVTLITGPMGVGKRAVAQFLSTCLLCERLSAQTQDSFFNSGEEISLFGSEGKLAPLAPETPSRPCGECRPCRAMREGAEVNFTEIKAEPGENGRTGALKIEQLRAIREALGHGAYQGRHRIFLISEAESLTPAAGNSLLKILEEPPPGWVFFLTATDIALVLPTLVSRCQKMRLRPLPKDLIEQLLAHADVAEERRKLAAEFSCGSWQKALFQASDIAWKQRSSILNFIRDPRAELEKLVDWATQDSSQFQFLIDQLELVCRRSIELSYSSQTTSAIGNSDGISEHCQHVIRDLGNPELARDFWLCCVDRLAETRNQLHLPLNRKMLGQKVLLPWLERAQSGA